MGTELTQDHHDWISDVVGQKLGDMIQNKVADGISLKKEFEYKLKKIKFAKGWITVVGALNGTIVAKAKIDSTDKTRFDAEKIVVEYGSRWVDEKTTSELAKDGTGLKLEGMKITDSWKTPIGLLDLEITLIGLETEKDSNKVRILPKFASGKLSLSGIGVALPDNTEVVGLKLSGVNIKLGGSVEVGPDAGEIIKEWLIEQLKNKAFDAVRSTGEKIAEQALAGLSVDLIITGSIVLVGVAAIAGAVYEAAKGDEFKEIGDNIAKARNALDAGWVAGASGQGKPGDKFGQLGFEAGKVAFDEAMKKIKTDRPDVLDDEARTFIATEVKKTWRGIPYDAYTKLDPGIRAGFWDGYLKAHTGFLTEKDAKTALYICFTDSAKADDSNPQWKKYTSAHSIGKYL